MYLADPLFAGVEDFYGGIAGRVLDDGPDEAMIDATEDLADEAARQAPKDLSILSRSAHPTVTSDGEEIYDRAPEVGRLSEDELYELHHGKPDLHGAGRWRRDDEPGGRIVGSPGKFAVNNPNSEGNDRPDPKTRGDARVRRDR